MHFYVSPSPPDSSASQPITGGSSWSYRVLASSLVELQDSPQVQLPPTPSQLTNNDGTEEGGSRSRIDDGTG